MRSRSGRPYGDTLFDWESNEFHRRDHELFLRRRRWRRIRWVAVALVILTGLGLGAYLYTPLHWYDNHDYQTRYAVGPHQNEVPGAVRTELARTISALEGFVEQQRGGSYANAVTVATVSDRDFLDALHRSAVDVRDDDAQLALAPGEGTANGSEIDAGDITGFYDPRANVLYVRGHVIDEYTRIVLVHALTHAYDDQRNAAGLGVTGDKDAQLAQHALVEGDAVSVEHAYLQKLTPDLRCPALGDLYAPYDADCRGAGYVAKRAGSIGESRLQFVYGVGNRFVEYLIAHGGQPAVDRAFARPPLWSADVLDPATYLRGIDPAAVPYPAPAGAGNPQRQHLGAWQISALTTDGRLGPGVSGYTVGWRGDTALRYQRDGATCLSDRVRFATAGDARQFAATLHRSYTRPSPSDVEFTQCSSPS